MQCVVRASGTDRAEASGLRSRRGTETCPDSNLFSYIVCIGVVGTFKHRFNRDNWSDLILQFSKKKSDLQELIDNQETGSGTAGHENKVSLLVRHMAVYL